MKIKVLNIIRTIFFISLLSGCASVPVVQPTQEELNATKKFKKTIAIIDFNDQGSPIKDMQAVTLPILEKYLTRHFNLVERGRIKEIMAERRLASFDNVERFNEIGKLLGADYLVFGNVIASVSKPTIKQQVHQYKNGKFSGYIWEESYALSEISLKFVEVSTGMVAYADKEKSRRMITTDRVRYSNRELFNKDIAGKQAVGAITEIIGAFKGLHKEYAAGVSRALESSIKKLSETLSYKFPQTGEIINIVSPKEVIINLGSAYGIKPGDQLIVWQKKAAFKDPKTGIITVPREKKAILKVTKVTSGLSCIARGSSKEISSINIGDTVYTYR